ncbi:hypothetical protein CONCODRAFT_84372 [Conidiobolus coronatus NRRL 28638]|uniref:Small ribosomal subunit protein mS29 n=1 Tax=Conidiobolus coronatus (strain ATCC 28846 / CBS 209.66 / NRRL 28638) TaxID=796925 RepID=A0A137PAC0_CONC2|nr:hypothetical protein CONCODRAFT_84372 [Conidiobolus coronatus NRRL 28638]|eukprot:KXN71955.1 hypothetical protein CONCODRAFT_84372 [Conidiobolus coronatus NRRL 28638]
MNRFSLVQNLTRSISKVQIRSFQTSSTLLKAPATVKKTRAFKKVSSNKVAVKGPGVEDFDATNWPFKQLLNPAEAKPFDLENVNAEGSIGSVFTLPKEYLNNFDINSVPKHLGKQLQLRSSNLILRPDFFNVQKLTEGEAKLPTIIDGESGSGKSALLLQLAINAQQSENTIVIYSPNTSKWINGSKGYKFDPKTEKFGQFELTSELLKQINTTNGETLKKIQLDADVAFGKVSVAKGSNLTQLLQVGIKDFELSHAVFTKFLDILSAQKDYKLLVLFDEVNVLYGNSAYFNPNNEVLKANQSLLVTEFTNIIEGKRKLKNGAFVGSTSWLDGLHRSNEFGTFETKDHASSAKQLVSLSGAKFNQYIPSFYSLEEAKTVAKLHKDVESYHEALDDQSIFKKFTMSHGNPRKFSEACSIKA